MKFPAIEFFSMIPSSRMIPNKEIFDAFYNVQELPPLAWKKPFPDFGDTQTFTADEKLKILSSCIRKEQPKQIKLLDRIDRTEPYSFRFLVI